MPACPIGMSVECARYNGCHECYGEAGPVSAVTDAEVDSVALVTFIECCMEQNCAGSVYPCSLRPITVLCILAIFPFNSQLRTSSCHLLPAIWAQVFW